MIQYMYKSTCPGNHKTIHVLRHQGVQVKTANNPILALDATFGLPLSIFRSHGPQATRLHVAPSSCSLRRGVRGGPCRIEARSPSPDKRLKLAALHTEQLIS